MVTALLLLLLACEPAPPAARDAPPAARDAAPDARDAGQTAAPPPPPGRIGGGAILDRPVVLGGIENAAVEGALDLAAAAACNTAGRPGKVLLRFHIDTGGAVSSLQLKASTLRHPATEACLQDLVQATAFPPLAHGGTAIVTWPFAL